MQQCAKGAARIFFFTCILWQAHTSVGQIDLLGLGQFLRFPNTNGNNGNKVKTDFSTNGQAGKPEACLPYVGEFARLFWSNCKQQADVRTGLTWSQTIKDAIDGGKITLDRAVKETCRLNAEKETCEIMGQRLAACDVVGVIQTFLRASQNQQRCEQVKSFIFQPQNEVQNAGKLVGNEILNSLVKRLLFGQ